jgi:hypothetical protein
LACFLLSHNFEHPSGDVYAARFFSQEGGKIMFNFVLKSFNKTLRLADMLFHCQAPAAMETFQDFLSQHEFSKDSVYFFKIQESCQNVFSEALQRIVQMVHTMKNVC